MKETSSINLPTIEIRHEQKQVGHILTYVDATLQQIIRFSRSSGRMQNALAGEILSSAEIAVKEMPRVSWSATHTLPAGAESLAVY
jgi:hypothetical protein